MSFDLFVQSCIILKRMTDVFKKYDDDRDGYITLSFEEFLTGEFFFSSSCYRAPWFDMSQNEIGSDRNSMKTSSRAKLTRYLTFIRDLTTKITYDMTISMDLEYHVAHVEFIY